MRVVILTHYYPPDPPGRIPEAVATELQSRGHDVRVLTTFPHYKTGRVSDGYKQRFNYTEKYGGVPVRRVPIIPSHSANPLGRIANYLSFAWTARLAREFVKDTDVIYVHGTPATVAEPARVWSKSLSIPYVYHVQDIWPESVTGSGFLPRPAVKIAESLISRWLFRVYSQAAAVNAIAPTAKELLIRRGVPSEKCHLVFNWADETYAAPRSKSSRSQGVTLLYAGNLGPLQDLETVIHAAHRLGGLSDFRLLIAGSGAQEDSLRKLVSYLGASDTIRFLGRLNPTQMAEVYDEADFQIVSLSRLDIFAGTIPSKFQTGLYYGLPLITTVQGDLSQLVERNQLGFSALPEDVDSLEMAFRKAYQSSAEQRMEYSRRARALYDSHFSKKIAIDKIEAILQKAVNSGITTSMGEASNGA